MISEGYFFIKSIGTPVGGSGGSLETLLRKNYFICMGIFQRNRKNEIKFTN